MLINTVLIVEDTPSERELLSYYLQEGGYVVIEAVSAKEALDKVAEHKPDVVVTDVVMPGMSGFALCRALKRHPITEDVPIIICTSKNQDIDRLWGMKQGADVYMTKPFTRDQLIRAVQSVGG
ncbi:hypothetical protein LEP3755_18410 [Leptolyngbya sp. NIES-3755]|nr:hypothetical protein LEP3755_18410 [Leptolyngbya sp. NIES-3755]